MNLLYLASILDKRRSWQKSCIVALTDTLFCIFSKSGKGPKETYSYLTISEFKIHHDLITLQFGNSIIKFTPNEFQPFLQHFIDIVLRVLLPGELISCGIKQQQFFYAKPTPLSAISRFKMSRIPFSEFYFLKNVIEYNYSNLDLSTMVVSSTLLCSLLTIVPFTAIQDISLPYIKDLDIFQSVMDLFALSSQLKMVEFHSPSNPSFPAFVDQISLPSISFCKSSFSESELKLIFAYINRAHPRVLEFHDALIPQAYPFFYEHFFESITVLNLDNTPRLSFAMMAPKLTTLRVLSLAGCALEISEVLAHDSVANLQTLCLSRNSCMYPLTSSRFPHVLQASDVSWGTNCLASLFRCIPRELVELDLSNAKCDPAEWSVTFSAMSNNDAIRLEAIKWDNNPVDQAFFAEFLARQPIESLSVNNCLRQDDYMYSFCSFVQSATRLKRLSVQEAASLEFVKLLEHLDFLDVSRARSPASLSKALSKTAVLVVDNIKPPDAKAYLDFLGQAHRAKIRLSFPDADLEYLHSRKMITDDQLQQTKDMFRLPPPPPTPNGDLAPLPNSYFDQPFAIFKYCPEPDVPRIVDDSNDPEVAYQTTKRRLEARIAEPDSPPIAKQIPPCEKLPPIVVSDDDQSSDDLLLEIAPKISDSDPPHHKRSTPVLQKKCAKRRKSFRRKPKIEPAQSKPADETPRNDIEADPHSHSESSYSADAPPPAEEEDSIGLPVGPKDCDCIAYKPKKLLRVAKTKKRGKKAHTSSQKPDHSILETIEDEPNPDQPPKAASPSSCPRQRRAKNGHRAGISKAQSSLQQVIADSPDPARQTVSSGLVPRVEAGIDAAPSRQKRRKTKRQSPGKKGVRTAQSAINITQITHRAPISDSEEESADDEPRSSMIGNELPHRVKKICVPTPDSADWQFPIAIPEALSDQELLHLNKKLSVDALVRQLILKDMSHNLTLE